ncbi:hypothetical protein Aduo_006399 [Ancylostoma duodenale]
MDETQERQAVEITSGSASEDPEDVKARSSSTSANSAEDETLSNIAWRNPVIAFMNGVTFPNKDVRAISRATCC